MKRSPRLWFALAAVLLTSVGVFALFASGHTGQVQAAGTASSGLSANVHIKVLQPVSGQVVTTSTLALDVRADGYKLDAGFAGTPNLRHIGHYHEILDGNLVDMSPLHNPNSDTISMVGVSVGAHTLTIVPANNDHSMIMSAAVNIPFTYAGPFLPLPAPATFTNPPTVKILSPANNATVKGPSFFMNASVENFILCGDCFGKQNIDGVGHWHIFVDQPVMANMLTMAGTTTQEVPLKGVTPGWHTFYAVLVSDQHMPLMGMPMPTTMTSVTLYVAETDE
jgi:hypothetical protein